MKVAVAGPGICCRDGFAQEDGACSEGKASFASQPIFNHCWLELGESKLAARWLMAVSQDGSDRQEGLPAGKAVPTRRPWRLKKTRQAVSSVLPPQGGGRLGGHGGSGQAMLTTPPSSSSRRFSRSMV